MKQLIYLIVILALGAGTWFAVAKVREAAAEQDGARPRTAVVERRTIERVVSASGFVEPIVTVEVKSEISGRIAGIMVREGDTVVRNQPLVELDTTALRTELTEAQRNFQAFKLRLEKARRDFIRLEGLMERQYAQESQFLDAQTELELAEIEVEVRQARLEKAQENLDKATILAPRDGIVTDLGVSQGQVVIGATSVNQGTTLMRVHDLDQLLVRSTVNEIDISGIEAGSKARISFDSLPGLNFVGTVQTISPFAINESNVRVFPLRIAFEANGERVRPGISANIEIPVEIVEDTLSVVLSAVFSEGRQRFVFVENENGTIEKRPVKTGLSNAHVVELTAGVTAGEIVRLTRPQEFIESAKAATNGEERPSRRRG